jgi:hypothetical protein
VRSCGFSTLPAFYVVVSATTSPFCKTQAKSCFNSADICVFQYNFIFMQYNTCYVTPYSAVSMDLRVRREVHVCACARVGVLHEAYVCAPY